MKVSPSITLFLGLLALPAISYATEPTELETLQQEVKSLRLENQRLREGATRKGYATPETTSVAQNTPEPAPTEPAKPAWKPEWMKDVTVSIGTKVWVNKWDGFARVPDTTNINSGGLYILGSTGVGTGLQNSTLRIRAEESVTPIPSLNIRYKQFFLAGSYYPETEFTFEPYDQAVVLINGSNKIALGTRTETFAKRSEWDFTVGYSLTPNIAFLTGYKNVREKFNQQNFVTGFVNDSGVQDLSDLNTTRNLVYDVGGPLLGISLAAPLTHGFGSYFNYLHGFMTASATDLPDADADYDLMEGGVAYALNGEMLPAGVPLSSATLFAGYRYQWIDSSGKNGGSDVTQGFATGLNLSF